MQRAERALDNPALDIAVEVGNALDLPVLAYFSAISNFPHANWRHYAFLNQGLADIEEDLQQRQIGFIVRRPPKNSLEALLAEVNAAMVIGDENPCREPERWRRVLAGRLRIPYWTVDADVVVPSNLFAKADVRPAYLQAEALCGAAKISGRASPWSNRTGNGSHRQPLESFAVREDVTEGWKKLDRSVAASRKLHRRHPCGA